MCWHKNCQENELLQAARLPVIDVTHALTNLPGENGLPANTWARAEKLSGEVYLPRQVIPDSRSHGGSLYRRTDVPAVDMPFKKPSPGSFCVFT